MKKVFITGGSGFIGVNLISELLKLGHSVCNFDKNAPPISEHHNFWIEGDLMEPKQLASAISDYSPDWVIHLAGRTDCDERTTVEEGYRENTDGTVNLLKAIKECPDISRTMITSSQYVCGPGRLPESDDDYFPHTVYGHSKVETEKLTRSANLKCTWFFIRPVNIWGPFHERYTREFWKIAAKGLYFHPNVKSPTRTYGYVGNVVWQMIQLMELDADKVHQQAFYVGDPPIQIDKWSLAFAKKLSGKNPKTIPFPVIKLLALGGDMISWFTRRPFYITSSRLHSMTADYLAPTEDTYKLLGAPPYSLEEGIEASVKWFQTQPHQTL